MKKLPRSFYSQDTVKVARELLGKTLVRKIGKNILSGVITETEAYGYQDDPASHAFRGVTPRNHAMFGKVGCAYVYFTYGMHYCMNAVAYNQNTKAGAVLIRGIHPEEGISLMMKNRKIIDTSQLTNGPAKLTQAMRITKKQYGQDLTRESDIFILDSDVRPRIISKNRVGIRLGVDKMWNFKLDKFG